MTVARLAAVPSLVSYHAAHQRIGGRAELHRLAQPVQSEPCASWTQPVLALDLARRDAVLARGHLEHQEAPGPHRDLGPVEDRPSQDGELLAALALAALPDAAFGGCPRARLARAAIRRVQEVVRGHGAAVRADRPTVPAKLLQVEVCVALGAELVGQTEDAHRHTESVAALDVHCQAMLRWAHDRPKPIHTGATGD